MGLLAVKSGSLEGFWHFLNIGTVLSKNLFLRLFSLLLGHAEK